MIEKVQCSGFHSGTMSSFCELRPDLPDRVEALRDDEDLEVCLGSGRHIVAGGFVQELAGGESMTIFNFFTLQTFHVAKNILHRLQLTFSLM